MKAVLEFTLPDEQEMFTCAINGDIYYSVISELMDFIRNKLKYENLPEDQKKLAENIQSELLSNLTERGIINEFI